MFILARKELFNDFDFEDQLVDAIDDSIETDNIINKINEQRDYE